MTDPYDPYRQESPHGQPYGGGQYGPDPYQGGQPYQEQPYQEQPYQEQPYQGQPYPGWQQPYPSGARPYQEGQQPYPGGQQSYPGAQPDATRQFDPYGTQRLDPYGAQQPYRGSYGEPPGWAGPGGPGGPGGYPPQPPRKSRAPLIVVAVVAVLVLVGGGIAAIVALQSDNDPAAAPAPTTPAADATTAPPRTTTGPPATTADDDFDVGQCATLTPEANNRATIRITDCGGVLSDVVIAKVQSSECAEPFLSFDPGEGKVYCLAMDAKEGDCFRLDNLIKRALACMGNETRKVVKIFDGVADDGRCAAVPATVDVYAYPDPAKTLCLGKAGP